MCWPCGFSAPRQDVFSGFLQPEVIPSRPNHPSSLRNGLGWDFGRADQETPDTSNVDQSLLSMPHISGLFAHNTCILYAQHRWWPCWWMRPNAECTLFQKHMLPFSFINIPHKYLFGFANISGKILSNISAPCRGTDMSRRRGAGAGCRGPMKANSSRVALEVDRYDVRWYKCVMILLQSQNWKSDWGWWFRVYTSSNNFIQYHRHLVQAASGATRLEFENMLGILSTSSQHPTTGTLAQRNSHSVPFTFWAS